VVGGRVATDTVDGFLLDRGFQVLNTSYPALRHELDLQALELRAFVPGVAVRGTDGGCTGWSTRAGPRPSPGARSSTGCCLRPPNSRCPGSARRTRRSHGGGVISRP
jgi:hypothetical protein